MAASILMESYLMAFGFAVTMGASEQDAHLFARVYDVPVNVKQITQDWMNWNNTRIEIAVQVRELQNSRWARAEKLSTDEMDYIYPDRSRGRK